MMRKIIQTNHFRKSYKRLSSDEREAFDEAILMVHGNPKIGKSRKGDLLGCSIYKFRILNSHALFAYSYNINYVALLALSSHGDFLLISSLFSECNSKEDDEPGEL